MPPKPSTGENKQQPTDDPGEAPALPTLREGVELSVEGHGKDGWVKIWADVRAALVRQGHMCDTRVKPIENVSTVLVVVLQILPFCFVGCAATTFCCCIELPALQQQQ